MVVYVLRTSEKHDPPPRKSESSEFGGLGLPRHDIVRVLNSLLQLEQENVAGECARRNVGLTCSQSSPKRGLPTPWESAVQLPQAGLRTFSFLCTWTRELARPCDFVKLEVQHGRNSVLCSVASRSTSNLLARQAAACAVPPPVGGATVRSKINTVIAVRASVCEVRAFVCTGTGYLPPG